jgi:glycosyltransferase involved in cell wall biosynthesis
MQPINSTPLNPSLTTFSVLIPCYNEARHLPSVLQAILQIEGIEQVLCVDDGSSDGTARVIIDFFPQVQLVCLPSNQGKVTAVKVGASRLRTDYVILVDADLVGVQPDEFTQAIQALKANPQLDMLVLRRVNKGWLTQLARGDVLITGERILRRSHLLDVLNSQPAFGFQLEVALNKFALENDWYVRWFPISSLGKHSFKKLGLWGGILKETRMFIALYAFLGFSGYLKQHRSFGRKNLEIQST